jgi:hypothetical protein
VADARTNPDLEHWVSRLNAFDLLKVARERMAGNGEMPSTLSVNEVTVGFVMNADAEEDLQLLLQRRDHLQMRRAPIKEALYKGADPTRIGALRIDDEALDREIATVDREIRACLKHLVQVASNTVN